MSVGGILSSVMILVSLIGCPEAVLKGEAGLVPFSLGGRELMIVTDAPVHDGYNTIAEFTGGVRGALDAATVGRFRITGLSSEGPTEQDSYEDLFDKPLVSEEVARTEVGKEIVVREVKAVDLLIQYRSGMAGAWKGQRSVSGAELIAPPALHFRVEEPGSLHAHVVVESGGRVWCLLDNGFRYELEKVVT